LKGAEVISDLAKKAQFLINENSTTLLTGAGVAGTVATAVLSGRASFKAALFLADEDRRDAASAERENIPFVPLTTFERVKVVWPQYIPTVGIGTLTITSIIFSNRISAKEAAALATAYGLSERAFSEYKEKVVEKLGQNKETAVRNEIAQDRINAHPVNTKELILAGAGEVLCYDQLTGRYFMSSVESIKRAENAVNYEIVNHDSASLSKFYDEVGLSPTPYSDSVGWDIDNRCEIQFSTVMSIDDRPCISVDFARWPKPDYGKVWS
jgi:hypothetical protein